MAARVAAFFDLDRTLLRCNSGSKWLRFLHERGEISTWMMLRSVLWLIKYELSILDLEEIDRDLWRGVSPDKNRYRVFGGQVIAQALMAAMRTVSDRRVHSLHGYFILAGDPSKPILYQVDRIRDGRSFATRTVRAIQNGEAIFAMMASFQAAETGLLAVRIFSEAIKTGGFFGVALGIAGLALVTTQIAAAVAQARRVQGFKGGVSYLDGPGDGKSDSIPAWLSKGERVVDAETNAKIGGAQISNADLLKYYRIGIQTEKGIPVAATSAGLAKEMASAQIQVMQNAYANAANAATDRMIEYWRTRPVEKYDADGSRVIEWKEGSQQRRQKIKRKS